MHNILFVKRLCLSSLAAPKARLLFHVFELNSDLEYETSNFGKALIDLDPSPVSLQMRDDDGRMLVI